MQGPFRARLVTLQKPYSLSSTAEELSLGSARGIAAIQNPEAKVVFFSFFFSGLIGYGASLYAWIHPEVPVKC